MPPFHRIWRFAATIVHHWAVAVGGTVMVLLGILQKIGQPIKWWIYFAVAIAAIVVSAFKVWDDLADKVDRYDAERSQTNHQKSSEVIAIINPNIVDIVQHAFRFIVQEVYTQDRSAAFNRINARLLESRSLIEKEGVFLPQSVCDMLKTFIDVLSHHVSAVGVYTCNDTCQPEFIKKRTEVSIEALRAFEQDIPAIRKRIDQDFRRTLGIESSKSQSS